MARILALTARLPYPPREGHQLRSWHVLRALARVHEVSLLSFVRTDDAPHECGPLRDLTARLELFPLRAQHARSALASALLRGSLGRRPFVVEKYACAAMRERIAQLARDNDLIHVDMLPLIGNVDARCELPLVLNAHNVEHALLRQRAATEPHAARRAFLRMQVGRLEAFETAACRRATHVLACSSDDAQQLRAMAPSTPVSIVPNGVDVRHLRPAEAPAAAAQTLVFVGQMGWFPNREGVEWFLREILPLIAAARPEVQFVLVGKADGLQVPAPLRANVRLTGFVDELAPLLHAAAVYVVPLRSGSGTRLKVLEAMAFGKAIVSTRIGAQGIELEPEHECVFADSAQDFAAAVLRLLDAPALRLELGRAARAKALRYDWDAIGADLVRLYAELCSIDEVSGVKAHRASDTTLRRAVRAAPLPS